MAPYKLTLVTCSGDGVIIYSVNLSGNIDRDNTVIGKINVSQTLSNEKEEVLKKMKRRNAELSGGFKIKRWKNWGISKIFKLL